MLKEITRNDVLNTLRQHEIRFSKHPNSNNIITLPRQEWNEDAQCPEFFDVDIRFSHPSYIYLLSELFSADKNMIRDGNFGVDIFSLVPRIKTIVEQLKDDGYLKTEPQKCSFHTEFGKVTVYSDPDGEPVHHPYESYINAEVRFSKEELLILNTSIRLTTKGQSRKLFIKEKLLSEPIGSFSLLISLGALLMALG
jgi:hypothetical protein